MSRILLVEDDELVGTMVRMNLERSGFEVQWRRNGLDGLALAAEQVFDLVLLDISLPGLDGYGVLRGLRDRGDGLPVLMLTARSDVNSKVRAFEAGADDYLAKPFDVAELAARAHALLRRSAAPPRLPGRTPVTA